ncbi:MAG: serine/threonine-protein phosphatase [Gemmatimonadetes bacterium]|nr:serine/threonine-protein phosphatase [Gemmatimonadota bacterium]NNF38191.1 serine/threonine-protein phosphatase [Gemmatimonadota bacterium]NNK64848.1 serine/threonine-protein phosphatase [Gemmatimonadota bacterium]
MSPSDRPDFTQIDAWGLRHLGAVRQENQDHFFVGALARGGVVVDESSVRIPGVEIREPDPTVERLASLAVVADGVGGRAGGEEASRTVVQGLVRAVAEAFEESLDADTDDPDAISRLLQEAALACHETLRSSGRESGKAPATTVTLFLGLWPQAYLLQVGDSRCYIFRNDHLQQISRDQTWAQDLVDSGALSRTSAETSRWSGILSSAVGGENATPEVTRIVRDWGNVVLLCSDGLTKHVSDELIEERIRSMTSSRQLSERLLEDALEGGGSDNIAIVVGRTRAPG